MWERSGITRRAITAYAQNNSPIRRKRRRETNSQHRNAAWAANTTLNR